jgi:hypothetical protein
VLAGTLVGVPTRASRRAFIGGALAAGAALAGGGWLRSAGRSEPPPAADAPASTADRDPLAQLGRAYLAEEPATLEHLVRATPALTDARRRADVRAALPAIRTQARDDFEAGRVRIVDGWVLSATEVRAAAIAALLPA